MARPFNRWDPSVNVDLHVKAADGPLVVSGGADPNWPLFVKPWISPVLFQDNIVGYLNELLFTVGVDPQDGAQASGYQYMPQRLTFFVADPANGEPLPLDLSDPLGGFSWPFFTLGHRLALRGWIGTVNDSLNVDMQVRWGDGTIRGLGDSRGAWTGASVAVMNMATLAADHFLYALHGKRLGDVNWEHRGAHIDAPIAAPAATETVLGPWNAVDSGRTRVLVTGGMVAWTLTVQHWDPGVPGWVDIHSVIQDIRNHAVPGLEDAFGLVGFLFHGATKVRPGVIPSPAPLQDTFFRHVEVSQFEPWTLDVATWGIREFMAAVEWITGVPPHLFAEEQRVPATDIIHTPLSTATAPEKLREYDDEGGWGIRFGPNTILAMTGYEDRRLLTATYPTATESVPVCLADDDGPYGSDLPWAYVGRYKLEDMASWGGNRCLVSFGRIYLPAPNAVLNGIGLLWRPTNGGELVLRWYNGAAPWQEVVAPFRHADYEADVVDVGFAWTGGNSGSTGLPVHQLRIVVDGVTLASIDLDPFGLTLGINGSIISCIGTANPVQMQSFKGLWFGGATFIEAVDDGDLLHAFDPAGSEGFINPSFETSAESGRPGEAENWEWRAVQQEGGFADFSEYRPDLAPYRRGRETFEGGWLRDFAWAYADEAARLAAVGFTADDVGSAAWQIDPNVNFILTDHAPITWVQSEVGENQGSIDDLSDAAVAAALYNGGIENFEGTVEHFDLWGRVWDMMTWSGPPWFDVYNLIPPCEDTLGPFGGPTGFDGWYDHVTATNLDPLCVESFEEAWGNDPMSTAGGQRWQPDTVPGGTMRGEAITFPLTVPPNENQIVILTDVSDPKMFSLPANDYADLATLVVDLNVLVGVHLAGLGLEFGSWSSATEEGLTWGWDGVTAVAIWFGFAALESDPWKDMRSALGLRSLSPGGNYTGVGIPAWIYSTLPAGVAATDHFLLDSWSANSILISVDPVLGVVVLENDMVGAIFDAAVPDPTLLERFTIEGWIDPAAVWISDLSLVATTTALFDTGTHDREDFLDTEWPDELYP